jgi:hypothetical protein
VLLVGVKRGFKDAGALGHFGGPPSRGMRYIGSSLTRTTSFRYVAKVAGMGPGARGDRFVGIRSCFRECQGTTGITGDKGRESVSARGAGRVGFLALAVLCVAFVASVSVADEEVWPTGSGAG